MEKKRVLIAIDKQAWEESQKILKELKISNQILNEAINIFVRGQYHMLLELKEKRDKGESVSMGDFLKMMGGFLNDLEGGQLKL